MFMLSTFPNIKYKFNTRECRSFLLYKFYMENFIFLALLLLIGQALYHAKFPDNFASSLNLFVINISLPAMVLYQLPKLKFDINLISYVVTPWSILLISVAMLWIFFKFVKVDKGIRGSLYLLIPLGNTSFVGIPIIEALYGESYIPQALIYDQFGTFLIFATYGTVLVSIFAGNEVKVSKVLKKIFMFPAFIALLIALFIPVHEVFEPMLKNLSLTLIPLAIISVGFSLRFKMEEHKMIFAIAIFTKLIILPLIALVIVKTFGFDMRMSKIAVFEAGMGPMITASILAMSVGFAPRFTASLVGYGIIISFVTLPLLYLLLEKIAV